MIAPTVPGDASIVPTVSIPHLGDKHTFDMLGVSSFLGATLSGKAQS